MAKYIVKMHPKAYRDIDDIYTYIADTLLSQNIADKHVVDFENAILSLAEMPYRGAIRKNGAYANRGYRQLFVNNYIIIYRIDEAAKSVIIVTIRYYRNSL